MKLPLRIATLLLSITMLSACSGVGMTNPFSSTVSVNNTYISQFADVPIPIDMSSDLGKTFITVNSDGMKVGMEVLKGSVEINSLSKAMEQNLIDSGWSIIASLAGKKQMQFFQQEGRYLVVLLENGMFSLTMELWMLNIRDGESSFSGYFTPYTPSGPPSPTVDDTVDSSEELSSNKNTVDLSE